MKKLAILSIIIFALVASERSQAQVVENKPPLDNFYIKENHVGRKPQAYVYIREADIYMKKRIWRMIDFREKFNQFFYYPTQPVQDRVSFMSMVMSGLQEGSITAYDAITDDFTRPLTYEEFVASRTSTKTVTIEDLDTGEETTRTDTTTFSTQDIKQLRVKEDWIIDRQRGVRDTRIMGLCPVIQKFDENGVYRGIEAMFWIRYPDCRELFVNTDAFNRHNSAMRNSYDDVFAINRFFNSYIYKIDNQQDRQLQEYLGTGWQLMQEAERLKYELLDLEEDLWEY
jgi:gliding motility associated protien GldN